VSEIRAVLFDLHDTLVGVPGDNLVARRRAAHAVLAEAADAPDFAAFCAADDETRASLYTPGNPEMLDLGVTHRFRVAARALLAREMPPDALKRMVDSYIDVWIESLVPLAGTVEALDRLATRYRLGLVSDFGDVPGIYRILDRFDLAGRFDPIVISAEVGRAKPHPSMFARALESLGIPSTQVAHVGDNLVCDVEGARRAGVRPILMDYAGLHPEFEGERIADLRELEGLLER
jgi:putative hydrolase of the HAD superfamily